MSAETPSWLAGDIKIDVSAWTQSDTPMKNFRLWNMAASRGDFATQNELMISVVKAWPFPHDPAQLDSYDRLHPEEYLRVGRAVGEAITSFFSSTANRDR